MKQCIAGFIVLVLAAMTNSLLAAPPRFNGSSAVPGPVAMSTTKNPPKAVAAPPKSTTGKSSKSVEPDTAQLATSQAGEDSYAVHGWLWRFFHRQSMLQHRTVTTKKTGELVDTDTRHKPVYDLLQTANLNMFKPGYDARWHVQASRVMCRLQQQLPSYGYVEFHQGLGQPLEFALYVDHPPAGSGVVEVSSRPPSWRHYVQVRDLGTLELDSGRRAITASTAWSRRLILELRDGMQPVLHFWDAADASDDIEVFLSAISFDHSLNLFNHCLRQLLQYNYKDVEYTILRFNPDSSRMRRQTYRQLNDILEILKADKGISDVNLSIYTSRTGLVRYNFRLATRRAQAVRDYLIKRGYSENKIYIKIHTKSPANLRKLGFSTANVYVALQRDKPL